PSEILAGIEFGPNRKRCELLLPVISEVFYPFPALYPGYFTDRGNNTLLISSFWLAGRADSKCIPHEEVNGHVFAAHFAEAAVVEEQETVLLEPPLVEFLHDRLIGFEIRFDDNSITFLVYPEFHSQTNPGPYCPMGWRVHNAARVAQDLLQRGP